MRRLPRQILARKSASNEEQELVCCGDCILVDPIDYKPFLNYKNEAFLSTCKENHLPEGHVRILMNKPHICKYFKRRIYDTTRSELHGVDAKEPQGDRERIEEVEQFPF